MEKFIKWQEAKNINLLNAYLKKRDIKYYYTLENQLFTENTVHGSFRPDNIRIRDLPDNPTPKRPRASRIRARRNALLSDRNSKQK